MSTTLELLEELLAEVRRHALIGEPRPDVLDNVVTNTLVFEGGRFRNTPVATKIGNAINARSPEVPIPGAKGSSATAISGATGNQA